MRVKPRNTYDHQKCPFWPEAFRRVRSYPRDGDNVIVTVPQELRTEPDDVVQLSWKEDTLPTQDD